ncbi:hypothetical protein ACHAP5_010355 [Fusarium lateritium]
MPSALGFIKSVAGGDKITSTFIIDDIQYHFSGTLSPAVQPFQGNQATLEYDDVEQLTSSRDFDGKVGVQDTRLTLSNGATISASLEMPISQASRVSGTGVWAQN